MKRCWPSGAGCWAPRGGECGDTVYHKWGNHCPDRDGGREGGGRRGRGPGWDQTLSPSSLTGEKWGLYHVGRGKPGQLVQQEEVPKAENSGRPLRLRTRLRVDRAPLRSVRAITQNPTSPAPGSSAGQGHGACRHCFLLLGSVK